MTPPDFVSEMNRAMLAAQLLMGIDEQFLRETINRTHSVAPILDPTAYQRGMKNLDDSAALAQGIAAAKAEWRRSPRLWAALEQAGAQLAGEPT